MSLPNGIRIGTSGWNYDGWQGDFYPETLSPDEWLAHYAGQFATVEINGTFYNLPEPETVENWAGTVPDDFVFSVKASRYLSHMKKLKDPNEPLDKLYRSLEPLGEKLGPILVQLPPNWNLNLDRLKHFLDASSTDFRHTFEFRDPSWLCDEVYEILEHHDAALCIYDYEQRQSPDTVTTDFVYLRLHGPEEQAYQGSYEEEILSEHARKCLNWRKNGRTVFIYFDNDDKASAPKDARRLRELIREQDR